MWAHCASWLGIIATGASTRPDRIEQAISAPIVSSPRLTNMAPAATSNTYDSCWNAAVKCCECSLMLRLRRSVSRASSVLRIQRDSMRQPPWPDLMVSAPSTVSTSSPVFWLLAVMARPASASTWPR